MANGDDRTEAYSPILEDPLLADAPVHEGYKILGGVVLYQKLGEGAMGAVYRGRHTRLDVDVAVKVMARPAGMTSSQVDDFVKRFVREARTAARIDHPNLLRVYDVDTQHGLYFLVMQFIDGESAGERLKRKGTLSEQEALEIALAAAEGLGEAHRRGVIHRDVKPDNIMVDKEGRVCVADLGLAKAFSDEGTADHSMLTQTQTAMGTPCYMPPEQFTSARDVGPAADVWSLGVTLFHLLSGELPWADSSVFSLAVKIQNDPLPNLKALREDIGDGTIGVIAKALRKEPAERYADSGELAGALRSRLDDVRDSPASVLGDADAGSMRPSFASGKPPSAETLSFVGASSLGRGTPAAAGAEPAPEARQSGTAPTLMEPVVETRRRGGAGVLIAGLAVLMVALGVAVLYLLNEKRGDDRGSAGPGGVETPAAGEDATPGGREEAERARREATVAAHLKTAASLRKAGLLEKAREEARLALNLVADHEEAGRLLAEVQAEIDAKLAEAERTDEHGKWMEEGRRLRLAGRLQEAVTAYEQAQASAEPGNTDAERAAAECLAELFRKQAEEAEAEGELQTAVKLYAEALAKRDDAGTRQALARARLRLLEQRAASAEKRGDLEAALALRREAAELGGDASKASALTERIAREAEEARRKAGYDEAIARARASAEDRRWKDVRAACEAALRHRPGDKEASSLLADARRRLDPPKDVKLDLGDGVTMELVLIPAGEFMMGSRDSAKEVARKGGYGEAKADWFAREHPRRRVRITRPFYIGRREVTQAQYEKVAGANPSRVKEPAHPVDSVSWSDAAGFCRKLSERVGRRLRLPTEAEWEYACRAGTTTPFSFGETLSASQANYNGDYPYAASAKGEYRKATTPVGSFPANAWGLHDMHGNVWEWCADLYAADYYSKSPASDPSGPAAGRNRVLRGGSWGSYGSDCRSALRSDAGPGSRSRFYGLRVALTADE